jgi:hypothetical protein
VNVEDIKAYREAKNGDFAAKAFIGGPSEETLAYKSLSNSSISTLINPCPKCTRIFLFMLYEISH